MFYRNLASALAVIVGVIASLGCCCPARLFRPPPIVVQPPPVVVQPNPAQPQLPQEAAPDVQQFINKNLGPNTYAGSLAPNSPFWNTLRQKVKDRRYSTQNAVGGAFGNLPFSEAHADGGVLIGFFVGDDGNEHVGYLQPIYLTAKGEKAGQAYGSARRLPQCFKAKTGYAVTGLTMRSGGLIDAFAVVFAKVEGERLSAGDQYTSPMLGGQGGGPATVSTRNLIIGIHGKRLQEAGNLPGAIASIGFHTP